jgi:hypothetical protein
VEANLDAGARDKGDAARQVCALVPLRPVQSGAGGAQRVVKVVQLREAALAGVAGAREVQTPACVRTLGLALCSRGSALALAGARVAVLDQPPAHAVVVADAVQHARRVPVRSRQVVQLRDAAGAEARFLQRLAVLQLQEVLDRVVRALALGGKLVVALGRATKHGRPQPLAQRRNGGAQLPARLALPQHLIIQGRFQHAQRGSHVRVRELPLFRPVVRHAAFVKGPSGQHYEMHHNFKRMVSAHHAAAPAAHAVQGARRPL